MYPHCLACLYHVHQADGARGVVAAQRAEEEDECVAERGGGGHVAGLARPRVHRLGRGREVHAVAGAVREESLVNVDIHLLLILLGLVDTTLIWWHHN